MVQEVQLTANPARITRAPTTKIMYQKKPFPQINQYGVSEVLSFSLIFALMLGTIAILYTQAYPILEEQKNIEIDKNVERSLSILDDNLDTVATGTAPSRETELKVADSNLRVDEDGYNLTYSFYKNGNYTNYTISPDVMVYETSTGARYYYFNGAIVQQQGDTVYFVEEPDDIRSHEGKLQLTLLGMNSLGSELSGGTHTIQASGGKGQAIFVYPESGERTISATVIMDTPNTAERDYWRNYYSSKPSFTSCENTGATSFECQSAPYQEISIQYRLISYEFIE